MILEFPPVEEATPEGIVALGGDLEVGSLVLAYSKGIFPWPIEGLKVLTWFCPDPRGILRFENLHISHSLAKFLKKTDYQISINQAFAQVIHACATTPRRDENGEYSSRTWITPQIQKAFLEFHLAGHAHSIEIWDSEKKLIGGLYGVGVNGLFGGESMFSIKTNASKLALLATVYLLKLQGLSWMDTQTVTSVVEGLGAEEVRRSEFLALIEKSKSELKHLNRFHFPQTVSLPELLGELKVSKS